MLTLLQRDSFVIGTAGGPLVRNLSEMSGLLRPINVRIPLKEKESACRYPLNPLLTPACWAPRTWHRARLGHPGATTHQKKPISVLRRGKLCEPCKLRGILGIFDFSTEIFVLSWSMLLR